MPFDGIDQHLAALALVDGVLAYYGGDRAKWCAGSLHDGTGRRCLAGAIRYVRRTHGIRGDRLRYYIGRTLRAAGVRDYGTMVFNDACWFADVTLLLDAVRQAVAAEMEGSTFHPTKLAASRNALNRALRDHLALLEAYPVHDSEPEEPEFPDARQLVFPGFMEWGRGGGSALAMMPSDA